VSPERWQRIEALFEAAAALPSSERSRFLEEQCGADDALRRQLSEMLRHDGGCETVAEGIHSVAAAIVDRGDDWQGRRLGAYRVIRTLGKGGMGAVFLAVRDDDQYHKEVAIKTLKFEACDDAALNRFRHERQILANLEHPNIASLLDGGATAQGT